MNIRVITPPTQTPVSLEEAKAHLRVDHNDDDASIGSMINSAMSLAEQFLRRALCTQTLRYALPAFPSAGIVLPRPPIQSVVQVNYVTPMNEEVALLNLPEAPAYELDRFEDMLVPALGKSWPSTATHRTAVWIDYVAGYATSAEIPADIRHAILMTVGHFFANREDAITGTIAAALPKSSESLLWPHRHLALV